MRIGFIRRMMIFTYVVMENMRCRLYPHTPETPSYFGCKFKPIVKQGCMSGGAGYVLSKEAVRRLVEKALPNKDICHKDNTSNGLEKAEIGKCLEKVNVTAGDSRDQHGSRRLFPLKPEFHMVHFYKNKNVWYWKYLYYKIEANSKQLSDTGISFH